MRTLRAAGVSRVITLALGTTIGLVLLVHLLQGVDLQALGSDIARADRLFLLLSMLPSFAILGFKVARWEVLFGADAPSRRRLFAALNVGYAVNTLLPARLGELAAAAWLREGGGPSLLRILSTVAVERLADALVLCALFLGLAPTVALPSRLLASAVGLTVIAVAATVATFSLIYLSSSSHAWLDRLLARMRGRRTEVLARAVQQIMQGVAPLRAPRSAGLFTLWTVLIWGATVLQVALALRAFHLGVPLSGSVLLTTVLFLGMAIPAPPGYVGVFDYLMVVVLGAYGVHHAAALAAAFTFHTIVFVPVTVIGLAYLGWAGSLRLQHVRPSEQRP